MPSLLAQSGPQCQHLHNNLPLHLNDVDIILSPQLIQLKNAVYTGLPRVTKPRTTHHQTRHIRRETFLRMPQVLVVFLTLLTQPLTILAKDRLLPAMHAIKLVTTKATLDAPNTHVTIPLQRTLRRQHPPACMLAALLLFLALFHLEDLVDHSHIHLRLTRQLLVVETLVVQESRL